MYTSQQQQQHSIQYSIVLNSSIVVVVSDVLLWDCIMQTNSTSIVPFELNRRLREHTTVTVTVIVSYIMTAVLLLHTVYLFRNTPPPTVFITVQYILVNNIQYPYCIRIVIR